ncbi:MAG: hypothetical protein ABSF44_10515 [Candidatus Bathyarchaeia archaeon]|jgi:hypothetical protein
MNKAKANQGRMYGIFIIIGIFALALTLSPGSSHLQPLSVVSSDGYPTAFTPNISIYGEQYNGKTYFNPTTTLSYSPNVINPTAAFPIKVPTVEAEMTSVFEPTQSVAHMSFPGVTGISIPTSWIQNDDLFNYAPGWTGTNPDATYNWNVTDSSGTPLMIAMSQYEMKYYVSFSAEWPTAAQNPAIYLQWPIITHVENMYNDLWIWFKVDTTPSWYIQGGGTAYFAIASIQLDDNAMFNARTSSGSVVSLPIGGSYESTNPESAQSTVYLHYSPFGSTDIPKVVPETYEGHVLNPEYFLNTTYFAIDLSHFGSYADSTNLGTSSVTHGDVATFDFDVTVFVIGQYTVQNIQNDNSQFGRFAPETTTDTILSGLVTWLSNPVNIGILTTIGLLILVIIFAPWLLVVLIALVFGGRRR